MQTHLGTGSLSCWSACSPHLVKEREVGIYTTFTKGNLCPPFIQIRGEQITFPTSVDSQMPSVQKNPYAKVAYFAVAYSRPLSSDHLGSNQLPHFLAMWPWTSPLDSSVQWVSRVGFSIEMLWGLNELIYANCLEQYSLKAMQVLYCFNYLLALYFQFQECTQSTGKLH